MSAQPIIITPQERDGITPRAVVAQTIQIASRADWYAFASACRKVARDRVEQRRAGEHGFWANINGRVFSLKVSRYSFGMARRPDGGFRTVCHGTPIEIKTARLADRPFRGASAFELAWAAKYRSNAARDLSQGNAYRKAISVRAAHACLRDALAMRPMFDRLPG